mmetsp:Transcript_9369/g.29214  ORF Transcript_9369/g.29214 Transcript_9369/m.29214 type:complete len:224 (+) Transcript_9369:533-1204(+)
MQGVSLGHEGDQRHRVPAARPRRRRRLRDLARPLSRGQRHGGAGLRRRVQLLQSLEHAGARARMRPERRLAPADRRPLAPARRGRRDGDARPQGRRRRPRGALRRVVVPRGGEDVGAPAARVQLRRRDAERAPRVARRPGARLARLFAVGRPKGRRPHARRRGRLRGRGLALLRRRRARRADVQTDDPVSGAPRGVPGGFVVPGADGGGEVRGVGLTRSFVLL